MSLVIISFSDYMQPPAFGSLVSTDVIYYLSFNKFKKDSSPAFSNLNFTSTETQSFVRKQSGFFFKPNNLKLFHKMFKM